MSTANHVEVFNPYFREWHWRRVEISQGQKTEIENGQGALSGLITKVNSQQHINETSANHAELIIQPAYGGFEIERHPIVGVTSAKDSDFPEWATRTGFRTDRKWLLLSVN